MNKKWLLSCSVLLLVLSFGVVWSGTYKVRDGAYKQQTGDYIFKVPGTGGGGGGATQSGDSLYVSASDESIYGYSMASSFDVSTATFSDSFSSSNIESLQGIVINNNGSKFFVMDETTDLDREAVGEFSVSPSYSMSWSFTDTTDVSSQIDVVKGVQWNNDGTKFYIVDRNVQEIAEYSTSSFDASSLSFTDTTSVSEDGSFTTGVAFSTSGSTMYVSQRDVGVVASYGLGTNFDVSTSTFSDSIDISDSSTAVHDLSFNTSGSKLYILNGSDPSTIFEFDLSTKFNLSTFTFNQSKDIQSDLNGFARGLTWDTAPQY